ncbi:hypothetical protein MNEG_5292 [Monoraphidium neglectum]|uniref:Uncharacterized protein n=1 Tax=Monoraphidium neglectum TaxID=145388 RepID=A0A0D2NB07_9CHLO|nr:hypothetical protein MNEG_5292 [Monoraphidium neglectum]KIZ02666.1 hypothetical protein MNEG_5292 [Monoraphidium neglectum]|eukprot:XP_013901685.1 hypothetical protein MNEG_5292 [Monoraphidium neglectum]
MAQLASHDEALQRVEQDLQPHKDKLDSLVAGVQELQKRSAAQREASARVVSSLAGIKKQLQAVKRRAKCSVGAEKPAAVKKKPKPEPVAEGEDTEEGEEGDQADAGGERRRRVLHVDAPGAARAVLYGARETISGSKPWVVYSEAPPTADGPLAAAALEAPDEVLEWSMAGFFGAHGYTAHREGGRVTQEPPAQGAHEAPRGHAPSSAAAAARAGAANGAEREGSGGEGGGTQGEAAVRGRGATAEVR